MSWSLWYISWLTFALCHSVTSSASATIFACVVSLMEQPTMYREYRFITAAPNNQPSEVQMWVKWATGAASVAMLLAELPRGCPRRRGAA